MAHARRHIVRAALAAAPSVRQVRLVNECVTELNEGRSLAYQMIMGAGKTSTILPLLALFLADGQQLMMQVMPVALLAFTRALMRERFSSIVSKPVYTFHFERAVDVRQRCAPEHGGTGAT